MFGKGLILAEAAERGGPPNEACTYSKLCTAPGGIAVLELLLCDARICHFLLIFQGSLRREVVVLFTTALILLICSGLISSQSMLIIV